MDPNDSQCNQSNSGIHLSDVIDVIEKHVRTDNLQPMDSPSTSNSRRPTNTPRIVILEQPASKALRFRYKCEGRSAGSIPGVNSTSENKTYPTIQIVGYQGRAVVVVSCVTKDEPYRPHPHELVGRENCKRGICTIEINNESMTASFQNLGVRCLKRTEIDEGLKKREELRVDPFRTGFSHKDNPTSIDLNAVRLCFQAFLGSSQKGRYTILDPVVSDPVYDKKAMSDLVIYRLSDASASVKGNKEMILLCEKVNKEDIQIRFFEEKNGNCIWEGYADFQSSDVHKQVAIYFRTPKYNITEIENPVDVFIQLKRPSDGVCSDPRQFKLTPANSGPKYSRKKPKLSSESELLRHLSSGPPTHKSQSSNFIEEIVIDHQILVPVPIKEEPETSLNSYLYPLPKPHALGQPSPVYDSRTPSPLEYHQFPSGNSNNLFGQNSLPQIGRQSLTGIQTNHGITSGCITTDMSPTINSQNMQPQTNYSPLTPLIYSIEDNNEHNMISLDNIDSTELQIIEDSEQVLSTNLSARLQLSDDNRPEMSNEVIVQENMNMADSFERIASNALKNLIGENYTESSNPY